MWLQVPELQSFVSLNKIVCIHQIFVYPYSFINKYLGHRHLWIIVTHAAIHLDSQSCVVMDFVSLLFPMSGISGSDGDFIFNVFEK